MDGKVLEMLVEHAAYENELKEIESQEQNRYYSMQILLLLKHLLQNKDEQYNDSIAVQLSDINSIDNLAYQVNTLKSENERLKHQFVTQKAMFESKLDTLKRTNSTLKDKNDDYRKKLLHKHMQLLAKLQQSPDAKKRSYIPTRQSAARHLEPKHNNLISDFSTTPYLKKYRRLSSPFSGAQNPKVSRSPSPVGKSYMADTATSKKRAGGSDAVLLATSTPEGAHVTHKQTPGLKTPQAYKGVASPLRQTITKRTNLYPAGDAEACSRGSPKLSAILRRRSSRRLSGVGSVRNSVTGQIRLSIFDDNDRDEPQDVFPKGVKRLSLADGETTTASPTIRRKRKLGGRSIVSPDYDLDDADDAAKRHKAGLLQDGSADIPTKNPIGSLKLIDKLGGISPLKKGTKKGFQI